ncbi:hypothetical protein COCNU_scaffold001417G000010 [Cocos nucifera]|nr:hypothetical protein [Cocos nucifera]
MDAQVAKMLTKGLYTKKRKGKAQNDGSKRVKVGVSSSEVLASTTTASEVITNIEIALTAEVGTAGMGSVPSMPSGPSSRDRVSELLIEKEQKRKEKRKPIRRCPVIVLRETRIIFKGERTREVDLKLNFIKMDAQVAKMLTKGLYTKKRKGKAQNDGSKRVKVGVSSSEVLASTTTASEVITNIEIALTAEVGTAGMGSVPSMPSGPSSRDRVSELLIEKEQKRKEKRKPIRRCPSPTNADPLPLGVSIKPMIKNLRKEAHLLRKKLKKMEDDLRSS